MNPEKADYLSVRVRFVYVQKRFFGFKDLDLVKYSAILSEKDFLEVHKKIIKMFRQYGIEISEKDFETIKKMRKKRK